MQLSFTFTPLAPPGAQTTASPPVTSTPGGPATPPARGPRDSQRIRVYRAEYGLRGALLPQLTDCRAFLADVVDDAWWAERFPGLTEHAIPDFRPGHGARRAFYRVELVPPHGTGRPSITLPRRYRTQHVVLHEAAHWALDGRADIAVHGPAFVRLLVELTERYRGTKAVNVLRDHLATQRVKVGPAPRRSPVGGWCYLDG